MQIAAIDRFDRRTFGAEYLESRIPVVIKAYGRQRVVDGGVRRPALALALTGIYAVIAYSISQRTREIGIRIALGARRSNIVRLVMGESGRFIALGLAAGVAAALFVMRLGSAMLFGVAASDPAILTEVTAVVAALSAIASAIPALRCQSRALCDSSTSTSPLRSAPGS